MGVSKRNRLNRQIDAPRVLLIDEGGQNMGTHSIADAISFALKHDLDLVELSPDADPPVCRVMDYGKYRFAREKKGQLSRRRQRKMQLKEIKLRPAIEESDYKTKLRSLLRFLEAGDRVKVTLRFRGREVNYHKIGEELLEKVTFDISEFAVVEKEPHVDGRALVAVFVPKKRNSVGKARA